MINYRNFSRPNKIYYYCYLFSDILVATIVIKNNCNRHWIKYQGHVQHLDREKNESTYDLCTIVRFTVAMTIKCVQIN